MRHSRFTAGLLALSLGMAVIVGGFLHAEKAIAAADHHRPHIDQTDHHSAFDANAEHQSCHKDSSEQPAIVQTSLQVASVQVPVFSALIHSNTTTHITVRGSAVGRHPPLFEHASLFAAIVVIRA